MKTAYLTIFVCAFAVAGIIIYAALRGEIGTIERQATDLISEAEKTVCPKYDGPRYAKFGDLIFTIPLSVKLFTSNRKVYGQGDKEFEAKCANTAANAQEFSELTLELDSVDFGEDAAKLSSLRPGFMSFFSPVGGGGTFSTHFKLHAFKNRKLESYPHEDGFYRVQMAGYSFLLVSSDPAYTLESGDPLTFRCATSGQTGRMDCDFFFAIAKNTGIRLTYMNLKQNSFDELTAIYTAVKRVVNAWRVDNVLQK